MRARFRILVVDDERTNIHLITAALKDEYEIISAESGYAAITLIKAQKPDLILLDVMMPDYNGFEVCTSIKGDPSFAHIPVIFLTGLDSIDSELTGLASGGIDFLTKPVNFDLLRVRVRNHLELVQRFEVIRDQRDQLEQKNIALETALSRIKRLEGIIPICMHCKRIRCEDESWQQIIEYISDHTDALFSHGICPSCATEHYRELLEGCNMSR